MKVNFQPFELNKKMVVKFYYDLMSQPSRSLYIFLKLSKLPFEPCPVALRKGEHLKEEFKQKFNKFQKVPFIHDGDFKLAETVAIFRYLSREYPTEDKWYPKDSKQRAKIDEYLEWQHLNTRAHCASYFQGIWLQPILTGKQPDSKYVKQLRDNMKNTLDKFEELFLSDGPFINGKTISFADILAACEIEQPRLAGFEPREAFPNLKRWLDRVRNECNPYYDEAHSIIDVMIEKTKHRFESKL